MRAPASEVVRQLGVAGILPHLQDLRLQEVEGKVYATTLVRIGIGAPPPLLVVAKLREDPRFKEGGAHLYHKDVGDDLTEFRSYRGTLGRGSMQFVIDLTTGSCYADIDEWNVYADLVNALGHTFGELVPGWFKRETKEA